MIKINNNAIKFEKFPNEEVLLKNQFKDIKSDQVSIFFKYEKDEDLIHLMLVKKELEMINKTSTLNIMYFPYSRMDRGSDDICFTLRHICEFLNNLKFESVKIYEPHSDKCLELTHNSEAKCLSIELFNDFRDEINADYILFPDKGCLNRYEGIFSGCGVPIIHGDKKRDFDTGKIISLEIVGDIVPNSTVVIIDDLCASGKTLSISASKLKELRVGKIYIIVGHAEKTMTQRGILLEDDNIEKIFTTNSIIHKNQQTEKLFIKEIF